MVAEKKQRGEKMPQPFGKRIGKTEKVITSKHKDGAWEQCLSCWGLYRSSEDRGPLQMDKKQGQHSIMSKRVKQNCH